MMSNPRAICLKCGASKKLPWQKCRECGFAPEGEDLVRSVYLSVGRYRDVQVQERYTQDLTQIRAQIRNGQAVEFDEAELDRLRKERVKLESVPAHAVWMALLRFFLPALLFLGLLFAFAAWLRR